MASNVIAKISANISELKTDLTKGLAEFKQFGERVPKTIPEDPFKRLKDGIADLGQITAAAAPFVAAGAQAAQFEADLRSLNTIIDKSDADLAKFGEGLRTVSLELGTAQGASKSAQAAFAIAGSGFEDAADAAEVLRTTLKAATAGEMTDAAPVAETLSGTLKAFGAEAKDAERFANVMFMTIKDGITTFPELTATLGNVAPIAASAGISIEELGAAIAVTTGKGIRTSTAVDGLKGAITNLLAPSKQAKDELARLGVVVTESSLKQKGLKDTLLEIAKANGGSAQSFKTILGDVQAFNAALALTSDGGAAFEKALNNAKNATDTLDQALAQRNKTFQASMDQFKVALEAAGVAVGTVFLPVAKGAVDVVTSLVSAFATAPGPIRDAVTMVGALGAATVITSKAIVLLTTAATRERLALIASTAAKVLNTNASVALTAGVIKTQIAFNGLMARAAAVSFSMSGMAASFAAARTATLGLTASLGPLVVAGAAVIALAKATADAWRDSAETLDDYVDSAGSVSASIDDAFKSAGMSAEELAKAGKTVADVNAELEALRQAGENIRQLGLAPEEEARQLDKVSKAVVRLRNERTKLVEIEKAKSQPQPSAIPVADTSEAEKSAEKARKESLSADLHAIDLKKKAGELSARQEITALEQILKAKGASLKIEEKQRIEAEIAAAQGKIKADNEKRWEEAAKKSAETAKKAQEAGKKAAEENFDLRQKALETERDGKKTIEEKLELEKQLVDLEAQKALFSEKNKKNRQAILDNAKAEKDLLDKQANEEIAKRDADLAAKRADLAKEAASEEEAAQTVAFEKRRRQLDEEEARGRNVRAARKQLEEEEFKAAEASSKRRLELAKAEIAAKRKAADVDASPEQKKINAEREALDLKKAERDAAKESQEIFDKHNASLQERLKHLREQLDLIRKAKEEAKGGPTFSGPYSLEQINENLSGWGVSKSRRGTVNQDGMTEADIEAEIKATEGRLGNRKEARRTSDAQAGPGFGTSKWDQKRAADEKAATTAVGGEYGAAISTVIGLLQTIARAAGSSGSDKTSSKGLGSLGVPYQLQPNSSF